MTRAIHVKQTWGARCDTLLFMSSKKGEFPVADPTTMRAKLLAFFNRNLYKLLADEVFGTIALPGIEDDHEKLWHKTQKAFQYIWDHHRGYADWFFRADDGAYVFTDNLRSLLSGYDPTQPHYLGYGVDWGNNTVVNLGFSTFFHF